MKNKKIAFSLVEVVIVVVIISVLVLMQVQTLKTNINKYGPTYTTAYTTLNKAAYNILADIHCPDPNSEDEDCQKGPRSFPATSEDMCKRLAEFISHVGETTCDAKSITNLADNFIWEKTKPDGSDDPNYSLKFTATNGAKYYISDLQTFTLKNTDGDTDTVRYFIVYVDINGKEKPNRVNTVPDSQLLPDIVPFAVTTRGEVIPMGYPTIAKEYLTARIKFSDNEVDDEYKDDIYSKEMTFNEAVINAWGQASNATSTSNNEDINIPFSIDFTKRLSADNKARNFYTYQTTNSAASAKNPMQGCHKHDYTCRVLVNQYMR